jgi:hypothetical protein
MATALRHHAAAPAYAYAPPAAAVAAAPPPPPDPAAGVPEVVEDRRLDAYGGTVVRRYERGRLLGKVSAGGTRAQGCGGGGCGAVGRAGRGRARGAARRRAAQRAPNGRPPSRRAHGGTRRNAAHVLYTPRARRRVCARVAHAAPRCARPTNGRPFPAP